MVEEVHSIDGFRWCTNCQSRRPVQRGTYIKSKDGLRQRWKCFQCSMKWKRGKLYVTNRDGVATLAIGQNSDKSGGDQPVRDNQTSKPNKRSKADGRGRKDTMILRRSKDKVRQGAR